jgi:hypothetical protein
MIMSQKSSRIDVLKSVRDVVNFGKRRLTNEPELGFKTYERDLWNSVRVPVGNVMGRITIEIRFKIGALGKEQ